jgi:hypothetical protein
VLHILLFLLVVVSTVNLTISGDEVLIRPQECGWVQLVNEQGLVDLNTPTRLTSLYTRFRLDLQRSAQYVRTCYGNVEINSEEQCRTYPVPRIQVEVDTEAHCPFVESDLCAMPESLQFMSEVIDSHRHLGLNAPPQDRVQYRRKTVCSPLPGIESSKYASQRNANTTAGELSGITYVSFNYTQEPMLTGYNASIQSNPGMQPYHIG